MTRSKGFLALSLVLSGCASIPGPLPQEPLRPDVALLVPCEDPEGSAETNGLLAQWLLAYRGALQQCNNQIEAFNKAQ